MAASAPVNEYPVVVIPIPVPTVAWANVKVGTPLSVTSSTNWTSLSPSAFGGVTCAVASVVASYWRFVTVKTPVMESARGVMFAVDAAFTVTDGKT